MSGNAPIKKFRIGFVTANVWKNDVDGGKSFYNVTLERSYKNSAGEWEAGNSFNHDELLNAAALLQKAETFISAQ
ncbi:hypothetical protein [Novosphingobium aquae]|uniref:Uncharacterized protein n=1 Tax=Novosphingobium aquae TaxID=3133435 RepID=A0ABU8SBZ4_9SPHN